VKEYLYFKIKRIKLEPDIWRRGIINNKIMIIKKKDNNMYKYKLNIPNMKSIKINNNDLK